MILSYIAGPLIGAAIGYCTNYIAVKMLFYPRKEIRLFGHRLPFTPGAIPRGKPRLAGAIGNIVGRQLFTGDDIAEQLLSDTAERKTIETAAAFLDKDIKHEVLSAVGGDEAVYDAVREKTSDVICDKIVDSLSEVKLGELFAEKGGEVIKAKTKGTMLEMFLSDEAVSAITSQGGAEIERLIESDGRSYVQPLVEKELDALEGSSLSGLLERIDISKEKQEELIGNAYRSLVRSGIENTVKGINVSGIIEDKINEMDVEDLEKLVLEVMKKELNTIVNLGALIGLVLGLVNVFFL